MAQASVWTVAVGIPCATCTHPGRDPQTLQKAATGDWRAQNTRRNGHFHGLPENPFWPFWVFFWGGGGLLGGARRTSRTLLAA